MANRKAEAHEAEVWAIADIKPHPDNARKHSKAQIATLKGLIKRFGFTVPLIVNASGYILAGHARHEAARALGLETLPVVVFDGTEEECRALMLADNRIAEISKWDEAKLKHEIEWLLDAGVEPSGLGFSERELAKMLDWQETAERATAEDERTVTIKVKCRAIDRDQIARLIDDELGRFSDIGPYEIK